MKGNFLPITREEMKERGWDQVDFVYVSGDAYVDHPSFGHAIITRLLESRGYRVGIIAQPDWRKPESVQVFGEPRLGFLVSAGNMDSMVNHYSVSKKRRKTDAYTPGGEMGKRPDYACVVYGNLIRQTYKKTPIILGGIEASLRRMAHYDYWSDKLKRSVLLDSGADVISYGMGEHSIIELAEALDAGIPVEDITYIAGTVVKTKSLDSIYDAEILPSFEDLKADKMNYARSFYTQYLNTDAFNGKRLVEPYSDHLYVVQNPPAAPLTQMEMDDVYSLPYQRTYHPSYEAKGGVPAIKEIKFSLISNRGCFGGCSFCALTFHQGRIVQVRSHESLIEEAKEITKDKDFKGYIHDVGGPTANFRHPSCKKQMEHGVCKTRQCLFPSPCKNLDADHRDYVSLLRKLRDIPKVKKVFIRSGIRFDYLLADKKQEFLSVEIRNNRAPHVRFKTRSDAGFGEKQSLADFVQRYASVKLFGQNTFDANGKFGVGFGLNHRAIAFSVAHKRNQKRFEVALHHLSRAYRCVVAIVQRAHVYLVGLVRKRKRKFGHDIAQNRLFAGG